MACQSNQEDLTLIAGRNGDANRRVLNQENIKGHTEFWKHNSLHCDATFASVLENYKRKTTFFNYKG